jgi:hypothetical protein
MHTELGQSKFVFNSIYGVDFSRAHQPLLDIANVPAIGRIRG